MKQSFHGYYRPSDEAFDALWDKAIIAIDANVMLNLYTYSETTSKEILALFSEFSERLWMPHQVALEYHMNRCGIISKESRRYADIAKAIESVGAGLRSGKQHPHVNGELVARFEGIAAEIKKELTEGESKLRDLFTADSICAKITELFAGRVGEPMPEEVLGQIYKEGATRYAGRIPPGFSDIKKPEPDRYGDLVVWHQLIEHARVSKQPAILVTDDLKEDWWTFAGGNRRIGPRPELRHEFRSKTEHDIYIYSSDAFIENADRRGKKLSKAAAEEIECASKERKQDAVEERTLKQLTHDPLEHYLKQQEMLERLSRDPLEHFRKQQEMLERLTRDPLEHFPKHQDNIDEPESDDDEPDEPKSDNDEQDEDEC